LDSQNASHGMISTCICNNNSRVTLLRVWRLDYITKYFGQPHKLTMCTIILDLDLLNWWIKGHVDKESSSEMNLR